MKAKDEVCSEIQRIMRVYREQMEADELGTPGGLEHMGDVWRLLEKWDVMLAAPETDKP